MRLRFRHFAFMLVLVSVLGLTRPAWAQFNAAIQGTVTDASGAAVANAKVTVANGCKLTPSTSYSPIR